MQIERRKYPRYLVDLSGHCFKIKQDGTSEKHLAAVKGLIGIKDGEMLVTTKVTDISQGGLFLVTTKEFPVDTILVIELLLPGGKEKITTTGVVRWTCEVKGNQPFTHGLGINFIYMKKTDWKKIERFLGEEKPYTR